MNYPVAVYCTCGSKVEYAFATQEAYDQFMELWQREHQSEGCHPMMRDDFKAMKKRDAGNKQAKEKAKASAVRDDESYF